MQKKENNLHTVYFGVGSNLGDRELNIQHAVEKIEERIGKLVALSALYITEPEGFDSKNLFVNAACSIVTTSAPVDILASSQQIEREMGRIQKSKNKIYADRIIDIDLLMYDNEIIELPQLSLPHPALHKRMFVIEPLAEIAPNLMHPVLNKRMQDLLLQLKEKENS